MSSNGDLLEAQLARTFRTKVADDVAVGRLLPAGRPAPPSVPISVLDLSGRPKLLMAIGAGNVGKRTAFRFIGETAMQRGSELNLAAVDPENRSLADDFDTVEMPPSHAAGAVAHWLELFFNEVMSSRATVAIDLGGGDTSPGRIIADAPDLLQILSEAGVTSIVLYVVGPGSMTCPRSPLWKEPAFSRPPATS